MFAVISGASRGIGRALAFALAKEGYNLALGARNMAKLKEVKEEISLQFPSLTVFIKKVDFGIPEQVQKFAKDIKQQGTVGIIVNNVGVYTPGTVSTEEDSLLARHMNTNLYSAWFLTRPFLNEMKERGSGHIFNICSVASKTPRANAASYSISKMALYGFHQALCEEMREWGVKVTAIVPGSVNTSSWDGIPAPLESFVQPEDVANAVLNALNTSANAFIDEVVIKPLNKEF
jgi:3-oxoacyl-[acyl-carrier protein] reductase